MPRLRPLYALLGLVLLACDEGPQAGSPGLEPPHETMDGSVPAAGRTGGGSQVPPMGSGGSTGANAGASAMPPITSAGAGGSEFGNASDGGASTERFGDEHATELAYDCQQTVTCSLQRDEALPDDPLQQCITDSSTVLDGDEAQQAAFLAAFERCKTLVACDYYDCATQTP